MILSYNYKMHTSKLRLIPSWIVLRHCIGRSLGALQFSTKISLVAQRSSTKFGMLGHIILQDLICAQSSLLNINMYSKLVDVSILALKSSSQNRDKTMGCPCDKLIGCTQDAHVAFIILRKCSYITMQASMSSYNT